MGGIIKLKIESEMRGERREGGVGKGMGMKEKRERSSWNEVGKREWGRNGGEGKEC